MIDKAAQCMYYSVVICQRAPSQAAGLLCVRSRNHPCHLRGGSLVQRQKFWGPSSAGQIPRRPLRGRKRMDGRADFSSGKMKNAGNTLCISEHFHEAIRKICRSYAAPILTSKKPRRPVRGRKRADGRADFSSGKMKSAGNTLCISEHFREAWRKICLSYAAPRPRSGRHNKRGGG